MRGLIDLCSRGGFPLTKFVSNSRAVLDSVPEELRAEGFKQRSGEIPRTSVLGVQYDPKEDTFRIKPSAKSGGGPWNRKRVLSVVMGIFDPLGQVAPYTLLGKKLNQELCAAKFDWNTDFPEDIEDRVVKWFEGMKALELLPMPRSFGLSYHGQPVILITFTDASLIGMGLLFRY